MLARLASFSVTRRRLVLIVAVVFLGLAGAVGGGVAKELSGGGFNNPQAPSEQAARLLDRQFHTGSPNFALLVTARADTVNSPSVAAAGSAVERRLAAQPGVTDVVSYWSSGRSADLRSRDGKSALVLARLTGSSDAIVKRAKALRPMFSGTRAGSGAGGTTGAGSGAGGTTGAGSGAGGTTGAGSGAGGTTGAGSGAGGTTGAGSGAGGATGAAHVVSVRVGGMAEVFDEVGTTIERDIIRAEAIAFPITAVLLVLVFGSALAAGLPLLIGVLSILGTFLLLHVMAQITDVSIYSVNLATSMGLGLGIDYSLFMVTRFREELRKGRSETDAVVATVRTAGRTVLFSALTVLLSLSALLVFPLYFLKSFAYAGIGAVFFALLGALVVLPAALAALGRRVDAFDLRRPLRRLLRLGPPRVRELDEGMWHRIATTVMKRPIGAATAVIAVLLVAGAPFTSAAFSLPDDRVLPKSAEAFQVGDVLRTQFPGRDAAALSVVAPAAESAARSGAGGTGAGGSGTAGTGAAGSGGGRAAGAVERYAVALSRVNGVLRVDAATGTYEDGKRVAASGRASGRFTAAGGGTYLSVVPGIESFGPAGERLVRDLNAVPSPVGPVLVAGPAASLVDTKHSLGSKLPLALGLIGGATFVLLFLFTGSVVLPVKALLLNLQSLSATFGAMVWVFQEGHLTGLIGDPVVTGTLDTTVPMLMFCVLFGLSMDYEVFLLSRIKEEYDMTGDNTRAVATGLERTGRLVTAAAALLALVFLSFVSSDISFIKLLGLGVALAVLVDATLVRGVLVPAFMKLMGDANWWAPAPLRRLHARVGLAESADDLDLPVQRAAQREVAGV